MLSTYVPSDHIPSSPHNSGVAIAALRRQHDEMGLVSSWTEYELKHFEDGTLKLMHSMDKVSRSHYPRPAPSSRRLGADRRD